MSDSAIRNHVLLFFMSVKPEGISNGQARRRKADYVNSIRQTISLLAQRNWQVVFCDNTLSDSQLLEMLNECGLPSDTLYTSLNNNLGSRNKGLGELDMLSKAVHKHSQVIDRSSTVSFFTGRRLMTNHYLLEKTEAMRKDALLSNPNFVGLDGNIVLASLEQNLFNDMFFSMRTKVMVEYAQYVEELIATSESIKIGSEQILFNFVRNNSIDYEWLPSLGLIRREELAGKFLPTYSERWDVI